MDMWSVRNQALADLASNLPQESEVIEEAFGLLDKCIEHLFSSATGEYEKFAIVCCHTLIKAHRFALGCYSLCLDGLAQEAGALLRPLIETWQQLIFYRQKPERIELALANRLPQAGDIAREINEELHNELRGLRTYLNTTASHFSFQEESLAPMSMAYHGESLKNNLRSLFSVTWPIANESAKCLSIIGQLDNALIDAIEACRETGLRIFDTGE